MNNAKEKADELYNKYYQLSADSSYPENMAKQCSLIAVDEITNIKLLWFQKDTKELDYWQEVKTEIEKL
jgi:hypothetical protein